MIFESTIKNGLPVHVIADIMPADKDVGYMYDYIDDIQLEWMGGGSIPFEVSDADYDRLRKEAMNIFKCNQNEYYGDDYDLCY